MSSKRELLEAVLQELKAIRAQLERPTTFTTTNYTTGATSGNVTPWITWNPRYGGGGGSQPPEGGTGGVTARPPADPSSGAGGVQMDVPEDMFADPGAEKLKRMLADPKYLQEVRDSLGLS